MKRHNIVLGTKSSNGSMNVTPKLMVFVKRNIEPSNDEQAAIMPSTQVDRTGHWSHLSDLPSQSALLGCTTICDTCYLSDC